MVNEAYYGGAWIPSLPLNTRIYYQPTGTYSSFLVTFTTGTTEVVTPLFPDW